MWRTTINGLCAHKLRLALTAVAVVLGVSFVAGTFILTDTVNAALDQSYTHAAAGDVIVRAPTRYTRNIVADQGPAAKPPAVPSALLATIAAQPDVTAAAGTVQGTTRLLGPNGRPLAGNGTIVTNWPGSPRLSAYTLRSGRRPTAANDIALDAATVKKHGYRLGQTVTMLDTTPLATFTLVGIFGFGHEDTLAAQSYAGVADTTAQALFGQPGQWDAIVVAGRPGVSAKSLAAAMSARFSRTYEAVTSATVAHENATAVKSAVGMLTTLLLAFAIVAMFVGTFIIYNTFNILVAQRTRELALLRALGASRRQVTTSVITESAVVGTIASAIGVGAGFGIAAGIQALIQAVGWGLPSTSPQLLGRTVAVSMATGLLATLGSSLSPARRAATVAPVKALSDNPVDDAGTIGRRAVTGLGVTIAGVSALTVGLVVRPHNGLAVVGLGAAATFVGIAMLSPLIVAPLAAVLGWPLRAAGIPGALARANAARNPRRTASTASALMIGVAVVAVIGTLGASQKASMSGSINSDLKADIVVTGGQNGFTPAVASDLRIASDINAVTEVRVGTWHAASATRQLTAIDPSTAAQTLTLNMQSGSLASLDDGDVLIDAPTARSQRIHVGQALAMGFDHTGVQTLRVGGIYQKNSLVGSYVVSLTAYDANYATVRDQEVFVMSAGDPVKTLAAVRAAAGRFPSVSVKDQTAFKAEQSQQVGQALNMVYGLLALSILIALIGIVNTLALSVIERTRELGLLRAIGMRRSQVRQAIRGEAVLVCLIGAILGMVVGIGLGVAVTASASLKNTGHPVVPLTTLFAVVAVCGIAGVGAAIWPARRASKIDVLDAIATA